MFRLGSIPFVAVPAKLGTYGKRLLLPAAMVGAIAACAVLSQYVWKESGLRALQAVDEQRVQLVASAVRAEVNRQDHLALVLSLDPDVRRVLGGAPEPARQNLNRKLQQLAQEADARALYVIDADGLVVASSDWEAPDTLVGRAYAARPYFQRAARDRKTSYLGVEPADDRVRYYIAESVTDPAFRGVAAVRIEFDLIEAAWERAGERVFVTDANGIVFLTSKPALKYQHINLPGIDAAGRKETVEDPHYPDSHTAPVSMDLVEKRERGAIVRVRSGDDEIAYTYQSLQLPEYGWTVHRLGDMTTIRHDQRDGAIIGAAISALVILLLLHMLQRHRAYLAARSARDHLRFEVAERTRELRDTNASLEVEIDERRRTETRLRSTQNELVQASKLAALGQMSAAIAHEINQPLAAIRTFMASTRIFAQRGDNVQVAKNLDLINDLAERMASITAHLKTFARKSEPGRSEPVAVQRAIEGALFLIDGQIRSAKVRIEREIAPDVWVRGSAVQLEQVMVNLITNALDAVAGVKNPWIGIRVATSEGTVSISVADNGHGFAPDEVGRVFDPFFTTKPIGKGLGLGLSVSYGIVQNFGGQIGAANRPEGGAVLTVMLPALAKEPPAAKTAAYA